VAVWVASEEATDMSDDFPITIYHNPACGTSRNTLAIIEAAGYRPTVVEYLKTRWTRPQLVNLFAAMNITPRQAIREKGTPAAELGLLDPNVSDDAILDAMIDHPILVNRPIVVTPKGTKLSRPSEVVLDLLDKKPSTFTKEDGEIVMPKSR
jgi:arsenate reductase